MRQLFGILLLLLPTVVYGQGVAPGGVCVSHHQCMTGAWCSRVVFNVGICYCSSPYVDSPDGQTCVYNINECASDPCQNGGTCVDGVNGYTCTCAGGYTDTLCDGETNECSSDPCQNGATCNDQINFYNCTCLAGYQGVHCETDIDECVSLPCQNGGTCVDFVNYFGCECQAGYTDTTCRKSVLYDLCHLSADVCAGILNAECDGASCVCATGYTNNGNDTCSGVGWCKADVVQSIIYGTLSWSLTSSDTVSVLACPFQSPGRETIATRYCNPLGIWTATNFTECASANSKVLQSILEQDITTDNVENVSSTVNEVSQGWESNTHVDVTLTVDIVEKILNTTSPSPIVINNMINTINNLLFVGTLTLSKAQQNSDASLRLASVIDDFSNSVDVMDDNFTVVKENFAMFVTNVEDVRSFDGRSMMLSSNSDGAILDDKTTFNTNAVETDNSQSGIILHPTLLGGLSTAELTSVNRISLYALRDAKLYNSITNVNTTKEITLPGKKTVLATRAINSNVIAAVVPGVSINNLKEPVIITFIHFEAAVNAECVYWDNTIRNWSSEGCSVNVTTSDLTVCHCNHLTNFALLMDVYGSGGTFTTSDLLALSMISYIGCGVSCLAVLLMLLTYSCFKRLKMDNPTKILMNLCSAIGLVNVVFIVGVQDYMIETYTGCKIVAVSLHYFLLAVMCWMMVEAFYMYLALVKVFNTHVAHFQLKSSLFGWGLPLIIVTITFLINKTDHYGIQPGGICWLERIPFYAAFLGPVCVTMAVNLLVFFLVLRQICRRSSKKLTKSDSNRGTVVRIRGAVMLIILLGLTWLFAIFAIGDYDKVFHYLFALTNTLQGLFIFIFYCLLKTEARNAWKMCLPCCTTPYEQNRTTTATPKGDSKAEIRSKAITSTDTKSTFETDGSTNEREQQYY